jgi:hypothetical protein
MDMSEHDDYVKLIQQAVELVCPYQEEHLRRLYHAGFLASYLASQFQKDPYLVREFLRHVDKVNKQ